MWFGLLDEHGNTYKSRKEKKMPENNKIKGEFSKASRTRLQNVVREWVTCIDAEKYRTKSVSKSYGKYLTFCTLTLSDSTTMTDEEVKRNMLNRFLQDLKRKHQLVNYLYCCEAQKNGRIHFHVMLDRYFHHASIRSIWNHIQEAHGLLRSHFRKFGNLNPPSTEIRGLKHVHNVAAYLSKYMTKNDKRRLITGRLWGCSDSLRNIQPFTCIVDSELSAMIHSSLQKKGVYYHKDEYYCVIANLTFRELMGLSGSYSNMILSHYLSEFRKLYCDSSGCVVL